MQRTLILLFNSSLSENDYHPFDPLSALELLTKPGMIQQAKFFPSCRIRSPLLR